MGNLAMYATKGFEYLLILGFLALFSIFYLYFTSRKFEAATESISSSLDALADWFRVPDNTLFHLAHTYVRPEKSEPGMVLVGMDDFAHKMAGSLKIRNIPFPGTRIRQGYKGWNLYDGSKSVDMLMPMSGIVVAVNRNIAAATGDKNPGGLDSSNDPYGSGWILKVKPDDFERESKGLLSGNLARKWMEEVTDQLRLKMSPELGTVMQDGGMPLPGMAKNINAEEWDQLLKEFFLN
jgi:glycine cleavage system H lipoate-binding protein